MASNSPSWWKFITKRDVLYITIVSIVIVIVGVILILAGYNEAFYVEDPTIRAIFAILTDVGSENAYIVLLAIWLFAIDWKMGRGLFVQFMITNFVNSSLKDIFKDPRPPHNWVDGEPIEEGYGFPSGHSQSAMGFWGYIFLWRKNNEKRSGFNIFISIVSIFFMITVPISRLVIGVHDLQDVVGGTVIGWVIIVLFLLILPKLEPLKQKPMLLRICLGAAITLTVWAIFAFGIPETAEGIGQAAGLILGAAIAVPIEEKFINYDPRTLSNVRRLLAGLIGLVVTFIFYLGLGAVFDLLPEHLYWLWRFIRYTILGLILVLFVPWLLKKILVR